MIQKKYLLLGFVVLALIIAVSLAVFLSIKNNEDQYTLTEASIPVEEGVALDVSAYPKLLSDNDKNIIKTSVIKKSTYTAKDSKKIIAIVRKNSLTNLSEYEQTFIFDIAALQTSYLVSLYNNPDEGTHIINILCLPKEQQIYSKDYCYEA